MAKRSRIKIIFPVSEDDLYIAIEIKNNNLERLVCSKVAPDTYEFGENKRFSFPHLKKSWLTEIKEPLARKEPESFESWRKKYKGTNTKCFEFQLMDAWFDGIKNYKLKKMVVDVEKDALAHKKFFDDTDCFVDGELWNFILSYVRRMS